MQREHRRGPSAEADRASGSDGKLAAFQLSAFQYWTECREQTSDTAEDILIYQRTEQKAHRAAGN